MNWAKVERETASTTDRKIISNIKEVKKDIEPFVHSFEAVESFKEYWQNCFYIYL